MEESMTTPPEVVRRLRESRAWSQQHLADVAGVSLRTIQRLETNGSASAETKMAVAAAFDVPVETLIPKAPPQEPLRLPPERSFGDLLVFGATALGFVYVFALGGILPDPVQAHVDLQGRSGNPMPRTTFVIFATILVTTAPSLLWCVLRRATRRRALNLPNASHWYSEPHRSETEQYLLRHFAILSAVICLLLCFALSVVAAANLFSVAPTSLRSTLVAAITATAVFCCYWILALLRRFGSGGA
jgi:transcriptional regulator with XRE-family HTH domain